MGSFYATCSITGMSLTHQNTYIQLLVPSDGSGGNILADEKGLILGDGSVPQIFFSPFGFPIKGNYYDYGAIENVIKDRNVSILEDFFELPIEDVMTVAGRSGWRHELSNESRDNALKSKNLDILESMTITYFRGEVYDHLNTNMCHNDEYERKWRDERIADLKNLIKNEVKSKERLGAFQKRKVMTERVTKQTKEMEMNSFLESLKSQRAIGGDYIHRSAEINMFKKLPLDMSYWKDIEMQFNFLQNMGSMHKHIISSVYGSQKNNFQLLTNLNILSNKLMKEDIEYFEYY